MKKNWRITVYSKELKRILYRHVFAYKCYVLKELARTDVYLEWTLILFINGHKEINILSNSSKKYEKYHKRKKNGEYMFP